MTIKENFATPFARNCPHAFPKCIRVHDWNGWKSPFDQIVNLLVFLSSLFCFSLLFLSFYSFIIIVEQEIISNSEFCFFFSFPFFPPLSHFGKEFYHCSKFSITIIIISREQQRRTAMAQCVYCGLGIMRLHALAQFKLGHIQNEGDYVPQNGQKKKR